MKQADSLKPRKLGTQERSRATVSAILEGAARIFAQRGYTGATTNHIAARAGVSIGTLYQYFPNKEALLVALTERLLDQGEAMLQEAVVQTVAQSPSPELREVVGRFVKAMVAMHAKEPQLHRVLFEECPRPQRIQRRFADLMRRMGEWAGAYLSSHPQVRCKDPGLAGVLVVQTLEALTHHWAIRDGGASRNIERYVDETVALIVSYLTAPPQPEIVLRDRTIAAHVPSGAHGDRGRAQASSQEEGRLPESR
jgi:AcrR family transcriptional regulator